MKLKPQYLDHINFLKPYMLGFKRRLTKIVELIFPSLRLLFAEDASPLQDTIP